MNKSTGLSRLMPLRRAHPTMNQVQRRPIARVMTEVCLEDSYLTWFPVDVSFGRSQEGGIEDHTETNLVNVHRVNYLTITNALNDEEAVRKLLRVQLKEGEEV
jgi:hypothetical protein